MTAGIITVAAAEADMFFNGGQAFHTSDRYIYGTLGSHGCVHILPNKAAWLWSQIPLNTKVHVFGRKPGT
jgi:L,D-transpeptidase catalytic domain